MTVFSVSSLVQEDIPDIVALWADAGLVRPWNDPTDDAARALAGPSSTILGGRIAGRLTATVLVGWDGHRGAVYYLAVADAYRGQGFGRALMDAAEAWLGRFNAPKLNLMVRTENEAVHGFYEAIGYRPDPVTVRAKRLRP